MIRNLASAMDGPEALLEADEYLQPKSRAPLPARLSATSISGSPPNTPIKTCWPNGMQSLAADSPTPQNQQNWDRELMRYSTTNHVNPSNEACSTAAMSNGHCGHHIGIDSSSSRYCSDPLKSIGGIRDCDVTDDCFEGDIGTVQQQAQVGNLKLDLPLDEDDYLMPSPQIPTNATQYMDLIGDTRVTGKSK